MEGLTPTFDMNGGNGWGDAIGAFAGALFGSWWGNGFGGGRNCIGSESGTAGVIASTAQMDAISNIQNSIGNLSTMTLQGQNQSNLAVAQGFNDAMRNSNANASATNNAVTQGFAGLNTQILTGDQRIQNTLAQGFAGLNTQVLTSAGNNALSDCQNTNAILSKIGDCCCSTKSTIMAEGQATRDLINQQSISALQTALCDAKSKIASLESQQFTTGALSAQTAALIAALKTTGTQN